MVARVLALSDLQRGAAALPPPRPSPSCSSVTAGLGGDARRVYRRVNPSVVVIRARGRDHRDRRGAVQGDRLGVLITPDGKIATAAHVVHLMHDITVEFLGESPFRPGS
jgi:S1-C subfamily serine protease